MKCFSCVERLLKGWLDDITTLCSVIVGMQMVGWLHEDFEIRMSGYFYLDKLQLPSLIYFSFFCVIFQKN